MAYAHERPATPLAQTQVVEPTATRRLPVSGLGTAGILGLGLGALVSYGRRRRDNAKSPRD
jgi:hypothetical protein